MSESQPAVGAPVEPSVRPRAWLCARCGNTSECEGCTVGDNWCNSCAACDTMHPLYALPPELAEYLLRHLQQERAALDGFLRLGNEKVRAKRVDAWIACLAGPNVAIKRLP